MENKKRKAKKDVVADVAWKLFKETGMVAHYLFYKEMDK